MESLKLKIEKVLKDFDCKVSIWRQNRIEVHTNSESLIRVIEILGQNEIRANFLCTIVGIDLGDHLAVKYLLGRRANIIIVTVKLTYQNPEVPSVVDVLPAASLYEREIHDLFGINFSGHPNLARLVLAEDWPDNVFPLRKSFQFYKDEKGRPVKGCLLDNKKDDKGG